MISRDIRIEGIDPRHLANLVRLMNPPEGRGDLTGPRVPFGVGAEFADAERDRPRRRRGRTGGLLDRWRGSGTATGTTGDTGPSSSAGDSTRSASARARQTAQRQADLGRAPRWRPPVVALTRGGRVLRLFRVGERRSSVRVFPVGALRSPAPEDLERFRRKYELPFVVAIDVDALPRVMAQAQSVVRLEDDMVAQQLAMARALREALDSGEIVVEPPLFPGATGQRVGGLPIPSYDLLRRAFDLMLPDGKSAVLYIVDGERLFTSMILYKDGGDLRVFAQHAAIAHEVAWRKLKTDAPRVVEAVSRRYGPVHLGAFVRLSTWHRFVGGDRGAVARAMASRSTVIDPCPPWLLAIVGAGAVSEAAARSAKLAGRLFSRTGLLGQGAGKLMQSMANPLEIVGIDPWETIRWAREWSARVLPMI